MYTRILCYYSMASAGFRKPLWRWIHLRRENHLQDDCLSQTANGTHGPPGRRRGLQRFNWF